MTESEFIELLEQRGLRPRREGSRHRAFCPAHNDGDGRPSLCISAGRDGRILLKCWSTCTPEQIVAALGLEMKDLFSNNDGGSTTIRFHCNPDSKPQTTYPSPEAAGSAIAKGLRGRFTQQWPYHNADGSEAFVVLRFDDCEAGEDGKTYRPIHRHGTGYVYGDPPGLLPLYGLPALLADTSSLAVITEGEKAADAAQSIGLLATTSAHGAKSPDKTDWKPLAGRDVVILPDHDQAGRDYAERVTGILLGLKSPAKVRIVTLPDLPDHGDICEWLEQYDAAEPEALRAQIMAMVERTEPEKVVAAATIRQQADKPNERTYAPLIVRVSQQNMKRVRWLVPDHFALGKLSIVAGMPGTSKSLLSIYLIAGMQGKTTLPDISPGVPATIMHGDALLVTCEDDPEDTIAPRIAAYDLDPETVPIYRGTKIIEPDGSASVGLFDLTGHLPAVRMFLQENPTTHLLVIDPVQTFLGQTDMNHNTRVNECLTELNNLAQDCDVAAIMISHFNKKSDESAMDRVIGSRGFSGTVRAMWNVTPDKETKGRFIMSCVKLQNAAKPNAMAYSIQSKPVMIEDALDYIPILQFEPDRIDADPDELVQQNRPKGKESQRDLCAKWIEDTVRQWGGPMELSLLRKRGVERFSNDTFSDAKKMLGLPEVPVKTKGRCWIKFVALSPHAFETEGWMKLKADIEAGRGRTDEGDNHAA